MGVGEELGIDIKVDGGGEGVGGGGLGDIVEMEGGVEVSEEGGVGEDEGDGDMKGGVIVDVWIKGEGVFVGLVSGDDVGVILGEGGEEGEDEEVKMRGKVGENEIEGVRVLE